MRRAFALLWTLADAVVLPVIYWTLRAVSSLLNPLSRTSLGQGPLKAFLEIFRRLLFFLGGLLNRRFVLDFLLEAASTSSVVLARAHLGHEQGSDVELFFRLGEREEGSPPVGHKMAIVGARQTHLRTSSCFFPEAMATGPVGPNFFAAAKLHSEIARTCTILSILSYRSDDVLRDCIENAAMLPGLEELRPIHDTTTETDAVILVFAKFVVVAFRGTELETARDWLTSFFVGTEPFERTWTPGMAVRRQYYESVRGLWRFKSGGESTKARLLALAQTRRIYCTGHSLGGGLATLLAARLAKAGIASHLVTFGAPPVGNAAFVNWLVPKLKSTWRFVHGCEFAPLAPPLPSFDPHSPYVHLPQHVQVELLASGQQIFADRTMPETTQYLDSLSARLSQTIVDHNPIRTLRCLNDFP